MNQRVVEICAIGKRYRLYHRHRPDTFKAWLTGLATQTTQRKKDASAEEEFWALRDVSLCLGAGECLALVGKNGSGKSTLLKILSRIVPPTQGEIRTRGRLASLLEVGTGFHPELTGRENIYLNGAMLGCSRREINARLAAIVDFSGAERFLDTPVKHYSSGMYVRLAYAVAAHVDADILVIDEVLAVGDGEFQQKCLNHLKQMQAGGKSSIIVSHNIDLIRHLASHVAWLREGQLIEFSRADSDILTRYAT